MTSRPTNLKSTSITSPLPGARVALILLLSINFFNYIDRYVLAAVLHPIEQELFPQTEDPEAHQFVEAKLGSLQTAFMVSYMVLAPIFGWLADRTSRWWLIGVGVILWSLASGASGLLPTIFLTSGYAFLALLLTRCFVGVGEAAYGPAAPTIISDLYPVAVRGKVMAWFYAAIPVGSALGFGLGGLVLLLKFHWTRAFYVVVPPGLLLGLWCFFMREPRRGQADLEESPRPRSARWGDYLVLLHTPSYVLDCLGMTAMTFAMGGIAFWIPRYILTDKFNSADPQDLGKINFYFSAILVVSGLVATLLGGIAGDKLRPRYAGSYFLVSGISMLIGFPMVLLVLWAPYPWYWIYIFVACFCLFFNTGPTNTVLANVTHPSVRASAFALNIFVIHALGDAISPAVIGFIAGLSSMATGFVVVSFTILVGGLLWLWGARYLARDTALAPTRLGDQAE